MGLYTQQDPIGIAGGLNLYGYANGDPVNYSDPFGLTVCFKGTRSEVRQLADSTAAATETSFGLDAQNCAENVQPTGNNFTSVGQGFLDLVAAGLIVDIRYSLGAGSANRAGFIDIDPMDFGRMYGVQPTGPGQCRGTPGGVWDEPSIIAHELGHAYGQFILGQPGAANIPTAMAWENTVHARRGRPARHPACH